MFGEQPSEMRMFVLFVFNIKDMKNVIDRICWHAIFFSHSANIREVEVVIDVISKH